MTVDSPLGESNRCPSFLDGVSICLLICIVVGIVDGAYPNTLTTAKDLTSASEVSEPILYVLLGRHGLNNYIMSLAKVLSSLPLKDGDVVQVATHTFMREVTRGDSLFNLPLMGSSLASLGAIPPSVVFIGEGDMRTPDGKSLPPRRSEVAMKYLEDSGEMVRNVYKSLHAAKEITDIYNECASKLSMLDEPYMAVHFRIEQDFSDSYCHLREKRTPGLHQCIGAKFILDTIVATKELRNISTILLISGTSALEQLQNLEVAKDYNFISKSTLGCMSGKKLTYTQKALVDLMLAANSPVFVGHTSSTFSNGASIMRKISGLPSFAYNCGDYGDPVKLRVDGGERGGDDEHVCRHNVVSEYDIAIHVKPHKGGMRVRAHPKSNNHIPDHHKSHE